MCIRRLLLSLFFVMMGLIARAEVLLVENFDAAVGTPIDGYNDWFTPYNGVSGITVSSGLEFSNYQMSGVGGAALLDSDCGQYQPHHSFAAVSANSLYVAFLFQPTLVYKGGYFLCLRDTYSLSSFNYIGRVFISEDGYLGLRFSKTAMAVYDETMQLEQNRVYLIVLKYEVIPGEHNDEISLYAFDTMPMSEPVTPLIGPLTDVAAPDIHPENILLRSYDANGWLVIDGIRAATSWAEAAAYVNSTTLVSTIESNSTEDAVYYNPMGQVVSETNRGVIIQGGKKYLRGR